MKKAFIATATTYLTGLLLGALTLIILAAAIGRYTGLYSLVWAEELVRAIFTWIAFLGAAIGVHRNAHFRLGLIDNLLPTRGARIMQGAAQASLALLGLALVILGVQLIQDSVWLSTNILQINFTAIYAVIPLSGVLFIIFALEHLIRLMREPHLPALQLDASAQGASE